MQTDTATQHLDSIRPVEVERYSRYLVNIAPKTHKDLFQRWLFAYASVHTTWTLNCKLYRLLAPMTWLGDTNQLKDLIIKSGAGLHNNRTRYIMQFSDWFWAHPDWFWRSTHENWTQYRDRIMDAALGIGRAKSSFVVEMTYPVPAEVICTDTHIMQLYGMTPKDIASGKINDKTEAAMETHWVAACRERKLPPVISRWVYWDRKQGYSDSRYWSFVFEQENYHETLNIK
jgi:hypothetical protein